MLRYNMLFHVGSYIQERQAFSSRQAGHLIPSGEHVDKVVPEHVDRAVR